MRFLPLIAVFLFCLFFLPKKEEKFSEKVIICGVCKNIEEALPFTISALQKLGDHFADYRIFIYEDNSSDQTPFLLQKWSQNNKRVSVISESLSKEELLSQVRAHTKQNNPFRTELIARARNIVLKQAFEPHLDDYPYVVMVDMDFKKEWNITGILDSFRQKEPWDAIFANGIDPKGRLYDRYALRTDKFLFGPELLGDRWWKRIESAYIRLKKGGPLVPVHSAFGGLAIYKRGAIKGCLYEGVVNEELGEVVQGLIKTESQHPDVLSYLEGLGGESGIKWSYNSGGLGAPVCCEHVIFHAAMQRRGYSKIFINPSMTMPYE